MTEAVKGKTRTQALELFERVHRLLTEIRRRATSSGKLAALSGVREYPGTGQMREPLLAHPRLRPASLRCTDLPAVSTE